MTGTLTIVLNPVSERQLPVDIDGYGCGVFLVRIGVVREPPLLASQSLIDLRPQLLG